MSRPSNLFQFEFLKSSRVEFSMVQLPNIFPSAYKNRVRLRDLSYMCESLEFPGKNLSTVEFRQAGFNRAKIPILRNYSEISLTFLLPRDSRLPLYNMFSDWIEYAAPRDNVVPYYDDIVVKEGIRLTQYRDSSVDAEEFRVKLINAYPISISSIQGNWGDNDFAKLIVSLAFEDFKYERPVVKTTVPAFDNPNDPLNQRPLVRPEDFSGGRLDGTTTNVKLNA